MRLSTLFLLPGLILALSVRAQIPVKSIPAFAFSRMNGKLFTDKDLPRNKAVFFLFFDPGCDHCQRTIAAIGKDFSPFRNTPVYLLSMENPATIRQFMNSFGKQIKDKPNITLLRDTSSQFIARFHPKKYPGMFLFDRNRNLVDYEDSPETLFRITNRLKELAKKP